MVVMRICIYGAGAVGGFIGVKLALGGHDVTLIGRRGQTTADQANSPEQRAQPFPETIALLEKLGSENNHRCRTCGVGAPPN